MRWLKFTANGKTRWGLVEGERVVLPGAAPVAAGQRVSLAP